ncbi:hypothetical protein [Microbacterium sp. CFBP 8794]|uniref:hypothetical protein n=1 Tax=Microbacterium sp. CFBP 8794 TaxID=2775269 RepID=UPI001783D663|nr:hypothetical protein [Microbacterium sp. CFBP 8794]MBD8478949.1 hypothetical protein [Microbacterium sp. CFBP 8794]
MAWTNTNPSGAAQISGGTVSGYREFATYRTVLGRVEMRFTDVAFDSGYQFQAMWANLELATRSGSVVGRGQLSKAWGVMPGFTHLGTFSNPVTVRLQIRSSNDTPRNGSGAWYQFQSQLRWNNLT